MVCISVSNSQWKHTSVTMKEIAVFRFCFYDSIKQHKFIFGGIELMQCINAQRIVSLVFACVQNL